MLDNLTIEHLDDALVEKNKADLLSISGMTPADRSKLKVLFPFYFSHTHL